MRLSVSRLLVAVAVAVAAVAGVEARPKPRPLTAGEVRKMRARMAELQDPEGPSAPQQIHLNYGLDPKSEMVVQWSTREPSCATAKVTDPSGATTSFTGTSSAWNAPTEWFHVVNMTNLASGSKFSYQVGCETSGTWSGAHSFSTAPAEADWTPTFAVFGDMGLVNERSLPYLINEVESGDLDIVLHIGDLAYDLDSDNGTRGDAWFNSIQNFSASIPVEFCPGNHESGAWSMFEQYRARVGPGVTARNIGGPVPSYLQQSGLFHSFDAGLAHIVLFSSEVYFYVSEYGLGAMADQFKWLEADLAAAAANRDKVPWIITGAHRPLYCGPNDDLDDCHSERSIIRDGYFGDFAIEPLLLKYGVDVHFGAHEHSYSRTWPIANFSYTPSYVNPDKPVHILTGAAGCPENQDAWLGPSPPWAPVELNVYGYGRLRIPNATHLLWEFFDVDNQTVVDSIVVEQHSHGPFPPPTTQNM